MKKDVWYPVKKRYSSKAVIINQESAKIGFFLGSEYHLTWKMFNEKFHKKSNVIHFRILFV